ILIELLRVGGHRDRPAVTALVERERGEANEVVAQQRDPPSEGILARLPDLGLVIAQSGVVVGQRADVRKRPRHLLVAEAAGVDPQPPSRRLRVVAQPPAVEPDVGEGEIGHGSGTSQSSRISLLIARISWRSSSMVALPQNQYPLNAAWMVRS